ncbi:carbamoyltransferase HypF [Nocardioides cynanchi]|uniref:carbamoyltransferase HypF n=1 Tax=Nocardioides cynanchi TaxID=2558918 RepID=UPI001245CF69|nr:carbamoyltransferase HypF [Nocardioides cynanchi]
MSTVDARDPDTVVRRQLVVRGVVQGVGFRPHVVALADLLGLSGTCRNDATGVVIEVEGAEPLVADFVTLLQRRAPPLARIVSVETAELTPTGRPGFAIGSSSDGAGERSMVPPDTATCDDCRHELEDPGDRRYRHPFITCTNCGPRFTITLDLPYDRPVTTMAGFPLCPACAQEYADPRDRRFHAQPIACHDCGPSLRVLGRDGVELASGTEGSLQATVAALRDGAIVAIKGLGGYHLACDASSGPATTALRERKQRPDQPFAVMVADLAGAERLVRVGGAAALLASAERPIVILPARPGAPVASCVAPGLDELGVMLAYTPVHHLLFAAPPDGTPGAPEALVMTSGNLSGEPLCFTEAEALTRLGAIADLFLTHDREIAVPCEDSVVAWVEPGDAMSVPVRRSRGYAPLPVHLAASDPEAVVLAAGAEIKNTFALARGGDAFVSAHVGDLGSLESRTAYHQATAQLLRFHRSRPGLVVADSHPGYASSAWARQFAADLGVPLLEVQHHHAHLASLAAEHGRLDEPLLGLVFDGTGYGCDATVWGGELLLLGAGGTSAERLGHLGTVRLPGGDAGVRNPVRQAALALLNAGVELRGTPVDAELTDQERTFLSGLGSAEEGWVATSSVGRLFDVVSSLLGVRHRVSYEAQAAIELEATARRWHRAHERDRGVTLEFPVRSGTGPDRLDPDPLVRALAGSLATGEPPGRLAWSFHVALADAAADLAAAHAARRGLTAVGLSGGVFGNRILLSLVRERLTAGGLEVLTHRVVPPNDGGLALGQVAIGVRSTQQPRETRS